MEASARTGKRHVHLLWLGGGVLAIAAMFVRSRGSAPNLRHTELVRVPDQTADLRAQLERVEAEVLQLKLKSNNPVQGSPRQVLTVQSSAASASTAVIAPEVTEESLLERNHQRIAKRYALLEQRFADEPIDNAGSAPEEQTIRAHCQAMQSCQVLKLACRYTMCRIELKAEGGSAAGMLPKLGLTQGGEIRRREDGTFLIFAGRQGFPFQEVNRVD